jgi:MFS transporter, NNP family, nitrate/nitrite transporter
VPGFEAWRWAFFVPGGLYLLAGIATLAMGQDACDGDYRDLKKSGAMAKKVCEQCFW